MKQVFVIVGLSVTALLLLVGACVGAVFLATSGMTETADRFFAAAAGDDLTTARSLLAEEFQASTDEAALRAFLESSALRRFQSARWSERKVSGGRGELTGAVTTTSGGTIPLHLVFVKEQGSWKLYSLEKPSAGLQTEGEEARVPGPEQQRALVKRSIHDFALALEAKDMTGFYRSTSGLWQAQTSPQALLAAFQPIVDAGADLRPLDGLEPQLEPVSALGEHGVLLVRGRYDSHPSGVTFEQKYVFEGVTWKLVGFSLHLLPAAAP